MICMQLDLRLALRRTALIRQGDRRSPGSSGRITLDTRVIIARFPRRYAGHCRYTLGGCVEWNGMMCQVDRRDYVGPTAVRAAVLPARAVYLVADGSTDGMRRAVREACTRWGGMTEPIIPVKPGGDVDPWWQQVAQLARADGAVNVDADPEDAAVAARRLGLDLVPLADIDLTGLTALGAALLG